MARSIAGQYSAGIDLRCSQFDTAPCTTPHCAASADWLPAILMARPRCSMLLIKHECVVPVNTIVLPHWDEIDCMESFGQRVKRLREARGMTQAELAKKSGMSGQAAIGNIENGNRSGSRNLAKLSAALMVNPYYLETGEGSETSWSHDAMEIAALFDAAPPEERPRLKRVFKAALGPAVPDDEVEQKMPVTKVVRKGR